MLNDENIKYMASSQFLIAAINDKNKYDSIGTCVLMKLDNRYFLITAAHVMHQRHNATGKKLFLLLDADETTTFEDGSQPITKSKKIAILIEDDIVGYENDNQNPESIPDSHDIAVIELIRENYSIIPDENFLILDQVFLEDMVYDKAIYIISGYPNSKNEFLTVSTYKAINNNFSTISLSHYKSDFKENPPKLKGMSGGGIWIMSKSTNLQPKLIGIFVSYENKKQVNAVKINYVLSLIKGFFTGTILDTISLPFEHIEGKDDCNLLVSNEYFNKILAEHSKRMADIYFSDHTWN